jgi:uncharacterized protein with NRDE domain
MCTVSYVPLNKGFVITSNRDENPARETTPPKTITLADGILIEAPLDSEKGGSWIALEKHSGRIACLLNGARKKHNRNPPYRKSRGRIVLEVFLGESFESYCKDADLKGIEPFTLILGSTHKLIELVWDGKEKEITLKNHKLPHIWSSSTLYNQEEKIYKEKVFNDFLETQKSTPEALLALHGVYGRKDFILDKKLVKTVSITQIVSTTTTRNMEYFDKKMLKNVKAP